MPTIGTELTDAEAEVLRDACATGGHRVLVCAYDAQQARAWANRRDVPRNRVGYVSQPKQLLGIRGDGATSIVLLRGWETSNRSREMFTRLQVLDADEVPIFRDDLGDAEAAPAIGGVVITAFGGVQLLHPEPGQGDNFYVRQGNQTCVLDRAAAHLVLEYLGAWLAGEPVPDPVAERAEQIRQAVESGDPYARPT